MNGMVEYQRSNGGIPTPEWMTFAVYFYPDLVFGNLSGFADVAATYVGTIADVLNSMCAEAGIPNWRLHVFVRHGDWVYAPLRRLFQLLRIHLHAEVVSGLSWRGLASLDVFVSTHAVTMGPEPQPMALWNASHDQGSITYYPSADHWWHMPVWRSFGQCEYGNVLDWRVDLGTPEHVQNVLAVFSQHARTGDENARRRIRHMLGHLGGSVSVPAAQLEVMRPTRVITDRRMPAITDRRMPAEDEDNSSL